MDQLLPASTAFKPSHLLLVSMPSSIRSEAMDKRRGPKQPGTSDRHSQEVSSTEWEFINLSEQEEDLLYRMYRLVGDRWTLIAGRIPGRKPEEIERFWIMKHAEGFAEKRLRRAG
ncbi:MYB-like transcription factor ETC3 [Elaeis guineensis]|uniref:Transcription factor TRY isoform X1 n=1 Tax=Elaeis guineensis var. tenera TaxID=51953 RepID=A0A6J0PJN5_ELAGV|nr:transcription factor TRY isoform X1 [Elaeis guineensis]